VIHNIAQNSSDNLPSYPPDNYHCSNVVYWRDEGKGNSETNKMELTTIHLYDYKLFILMCTTVSRQVLREKERYEVQLQSSLHIMMDPPKMSVYGRPSPRKYCKTLNFCVHFHESSKIVKLNIVKFLYTQT